MIEVDYEDLPVVADAAQRRSRRARCSCTSGAGNLLRVRLRR